MGRLSYFAVTSLDGYVNDADGGFGWAAPDDEVHRFANDFLRAYDTYLYGRRLYETMAFWEDGGDGPDDPAAMHEFAHIWRAADKVVYSTTLDSVTTERTRLERAFDPGAVRELKAAHDVVIGGPGLAASALAAGLVDELHLVVVPAIVGGGTTWLPPGLSRSLELVGHRRFGNGSVHLRYR